MAQCCGQPLVLLVPLAGPPVQFRLEIGLPLPQAVAQQVGKEVVIAIPAPVVVQGYDKKVVVFQIFQHRLGAIWFQVWPRSLDQKVA